MKAQRNSWVFCAECGCELDEEVQPPPTPKSKPDLSFGSARVPLHQREWIAQKSEGLGVKTFLGNLIAKSEDLPAPLGIRRGSPGVEVMFCMPRADYEAFVARCPKQHGAIAGIVRDLIEREIQIQGGEL